MKYIYHGLLKLTTLALVSLFVMVPSYASAQVLTNMSDLPPAGLAADDQCVDLTAVPSFGYRSSDQTTSGSVSGLQNFLINKGYLQSEATGYFGAMTLKAVKSYQAAKGFGQTGYVGPLTRGAMKTDSCGTTSTQNGGVSQSGTSGNTSLIKGKVLNADGTAATSAYLKCGKQGGDYVMYSPNSSTGEVSFSPSACTVGIVWVSCPGSLVATPATLSPTDFNGKTVTCAGPGTVVTTVAPTNPASWTTPVQQFCPDGTLKPTVVIGPSTGCENHEYKFAFYIANAQNGPYTLNGTAYNNAPLYSRTTGVSKNNPPKGCAQLALATGSTSCSNVANYRDFTSAEWLDNTTIQTVVTNPLDFPVSSYKTFVVYPGGSPIQTGTFTLASKTTTGTSVTGGAPAMTSSNYESSGYVANGVVYNNMPVYTRTTGVQKGGEPKGCMQIAGDTACKLASSYRSFTSAEWISNDIIQTVVTNPSVYPTTSYEAYIMYPGGTPIMTGRFTLQAPAVATTPGTVCAGPGACGVQVIGGYSWRVYVNLLGTVTWQGLDARGLSTPSEECNASIVNQTRTVGIDTIKCEVWYK
jgi:peptidoglycan hydrolase-like protein with peptidoglycan-binding domain